MHITAILMLRSWTYGCVAKRFHQLALVPVHYLVADGVLNVHYFHLGLREGLAILSQHFLNFVEISLIDVAIQATVENHVYY